MQVRAMGQTGLTVSALGLGAAPLGNPALCAVDEAIALIRHALDQGITCIDTAPLYGRGESERRIGLALRTHAQSQQVIVATKVGYVPDDYDYSAAATLASVAASQERLGLASIPLVQIHELRNEIYDRAMGPNGALVALKRLRAEGSIGHIGVTGSDLTALDRAVRTGAFATLLVWRHFHLLDRSALRVVQAAAERGMGVIVGTPLASGILATGNQWHATYMYEAAPPSIRRQIERLETHGRAAQVSLRAMALQWLLCQPGVSTVIAGAETIEQIDSNIAALDEPISDDLWAMLSRLSVD